MTPNRADTSISINSSALIIFSIRTISYQLQKVLFCSSLMHLFMYIIYLTTYDIRRIKVLLYVNIFVTKGLFDIQYKDNEDQSDVNKILDAHLIPDKKMSRFSCPQIFQKLKRQQAIIWDRWRYLQMTQLHYKRCEWIHVVNITQQIQPKVS